MSQLLLTRKVVLSWTKRLKKAQMATYQLSTNVLGINGCEAVDELLLWARTAPHVDTRPPWSKDEIVRLHRGLLKAEAEALTRVAYTGPRKPLQAPRHNQELMTCEVQETIKALRQRREDYGLSRKQMSALTGVKECTIWAIENVPFVYISPKLKEYLEAIDRLERDGALKREVAA